MDNWKDTLSAFLKGPGWFPGTGRLGDDSFVPEVPDRELYAPYNSMFDGFYTAVHFFETFLLMIFLSGNHVRRSSGSRNLKEQVQCCLTVSGIGWLQPISNLLIHNLGLDLIWIDF